MFGMRLISFGSAIVALLALTLSPAIAQKPRATQAKPAVQIPVVAATALPEKCLRALNGACVNPVVVEETRLRAFIIPEVRVSYFGTPAGTIGGAYIPFERFFQDNPVVFGLPTITLVNPACCVTRSK